MFKLLNSFNGLLYHILVADFILGVLIPPRTFGTVGCHFHRNISPQLVPGGCVLIKLIGPTANFLFDQFITTRILFHVREDLIDHLNQWLRTSPAFGEAIRFEIGQLLVY